MKLILAKTEMAVPAPKLMRTAGFIYIVDRHTGTGSFSRPLGRYHYPRFHSYIEERAESLVINLHLDQKQATYEGSNRHSGEYDGEAVAGEMARLKAVALASGYREMAANVQRVSPPLVASRTSGVSASQGLGVGDFAATARKYEAKKSWWKKLFG
ncbi:MAG TPA: hypothetical protein PLJ58_03550 [bacterium]|nr:hypothetical protein [bacterium]